jgi:hypothetical protein
LFRSLKPIAIAVFVLSMAVAAEAAPAGPQTRHELDESVLPLAVVGQPFSYQFETALRDPAPTFSVSGGQLPGGIALSEAGLLAGVPADFGTFKFTVGASNGAGQETTPELTLVATGPPLLSLSAAQGLTSTSADLSASINPRNIAANAWFEFWPAANPADVDYTAAQTVAAGADAVPISAQIKGLKPETDYMFRAMAVNDVTPKGVFTDPLGLTTPLPPPTAGETFNLEPVDGRTAIKCPTDADFKTLDEPEQVSLDCQIDTNHGTVGLTASKGSSGQTQTAQFWGGLFGISQEHGDDQDAVLSLAGALRCERKKSGKKRRRGGQPRARKGGGGRQLWGSGSGNYKTVGSHGAATVRGTIWLVSDRCNGDTLFKVSRGTVAVRDFTKQANVVLNAGEQYTAKGRIARLP